MITRDAIVRQRKSSKSKWHAARTQNYDDARSSQKIVLFRQAVEVASEFAGVKLLVQAEFRCMLFPGLQAALATQSTGVRCLTLRSSRAPTACRAGHQAQGLRPILRLPPVTPHRRCRLSSNVRLHKWHCGDIPPLNWCQHTTSFETASLRLSSSGRGTRRNGSGSAQGTFPSRTRPPSPLVKSNLRNLIHTTISTFLTMKNVQLAQVVAHSMSQ